MPEYLHPGVYVHEEPSGARPIEGASTSTACFVGMAQRGRPSHPVFITGFDGFERNFGGQYKGSHLPTSLFHFFLNGGLRTYVIRVVPGDAATATATLSGDAGDITIDAAGEGLWGNALKVQVSLNPYGAPPGSPPTAGQVQYDWVILEARDGEYTEVERFNSLGVIEDGDRFYAAVLNRDSQYIRIKLPAGSDDYVEGEITTALLEVDLANGTDGTGQPTAQDYKDALASLDRIDDVSILAIPGAMTTEIANPTIAAVGTDYAARRRDMIYILDSPGAARDTRTPDKQLDDVRSFLDNEYPTKDSYTALYFPWVEIADPFSKLPGATRFAPPSGFIAGLYARTDNTRGVWKAPAGTTASILGSVGLAVEATDQDQDTLNPRGINCIRNFKDSGIVCWGARTLAVVSNPSYKYVPVRRLALFLEKSLYRGTQWVVFEPNDEPLWSVVRANIDAFMTSLYRQGALEGSKPDQAFLVKCDATNNISATIDQGQLHILVAFAPLKPAEFVIIHIQQMARK